MNVIYLFNKKLGYSVDVKETYGDLIYLDTIASERFNYEDTETGAIYDSQAELDKEQPDKNLQKVENTHEIEHLYVQVYSEVQKDNMDIRVPVDFDDSKFNINDKVIVVQNNYEIASYLTLNHTQF